MGIPYAEVIGDPIAHSKSPAIHKFWLAKLGIEGDYRAIRVRGEELEDYLRLRSADADWRGCNVTMPLKERIMPLLDSVTREAGKIGAVNAVRRGEDGRLHGRNTDVHGVARSLDYLIEPAMEIVLIGAGGAARAAAHIIRSYDPQHVTLINRSAGRGTKLLRDFYLPGTATFDPTLPKADLVINAAPPHRAFDLTPLAENAIVFDMVYDPPEGALLAQAGRRGLRTVDGLTMLIHQASEAFCTFFREAHPPDADAKLKELLTS
ncbi:MAG TPA: shikimate dehydrogenase [Allosphingosinicella sp.]|nr:shikimate dehydrogenase [Allosphingosinicella sp.]